MPPARAIFASPSARARLERARAFLARVPPGAPVLVVAATLDAANELVRTASLAGERATFGLFRFTIGGLAAALAAPALAERGLAPVGALPLEALAGRVVDLVHARGMLGRYAAVATFPGLPRAVARTLVELRMADIKPARLRVGLEELGSLHVGFEEELASAKLADRALVVRLATEAAQSANPEPDAAPTSSPQLGFAFDLGAPAKARTPGLAAGLVGHPLIVLDASIATALERDFLAALAAKSPDVLVTVPTGDERTLTNARTALGIKRAQPPAEAPTTTSLERLQTRLFSDASTAETPIDGGVSILSAPGESRECVEIARAALLHASRGVPFDEMAILLRAPLAYRAHVSEALARAEIPAYFARGTVSPDPAGRALVALLACAAENLSAKRFAEYLSLAQVPRAADEGAPPPPAAERDRWVPPDEELARIRAVPPDTTADPDAEGDTPDEPDTAPVVAGSLRAPHRWEDLLVESAVIGGIDRWKRRLDGLAERLRLDREAADATDERAFARIDRTLGDLAALRRFALPLLADLAALPASATWGSWLDALSALATRALKRPERVLAVLGELAPMARVGPVDLPEVVRVLEERLTELVVLPRERRAGRIFVAPIDAARGLAFRVVFVPGLAEKIFPQKVIEDPLLRDHERRALGLDTNPERVSQERLALRLAVGAATEQVILSYPRVDLEQSRPRVPSFYGLEVLRAAEGRLPGFDELARRAESTGGARIGWPAPPVPELAIDQAEYDLSLLAALFHRPAAETDGMAHYLLENETLGRALRFRARRWELKAFSNADGLVKPGPAARAALDKHGLANRSFSPTALQNFASCPYRFFLYSVHKLSPREVPEGIEEIDALSRGSLVHEVLCELVTELRDAGELPVAAARLDGARVRLDRILRAVADRFREDLAPAAIDRVWDDGIDQIGADLREWLRRSSEDTRWSPAHLELSFGLADRRMRDDKSCDDAVLLDEGIRLRGSIDAVERSTAGTLRATDYKTGKKRTATGVVIGGGETLQPVLYALVLEKLFPDMRVEGGRLYYLTSTGGFEDVVIPLDETARAGAKLVVDTIGGALRDGFLPAAPAKDGCMWCDYKRLCGPWEEQRLARKAQEPLARLKRLRGTD